jgi:hypothetical protein
MHTVGPKEPHAIRVVLLFLLILEVHVSSLAAIGVGCADSSLEAFGGVVTEGVGGMGLDTLTAEKLVIVDEHFRSCTCIVAVGAVKDLCFGGNHGCSSAHVRHMCLLKFQSLGSKQ